MSIFYGNFSTALDLVVVTLRRAEEEAVKFILPLLSFSPFQEKKEEEGEKRAIQFSHPLNLVLLFLSPAVSDSLKSARN